MTLSPRAVPVATKAARMSNRSSGSENVRHAWSPGLSRSTAHARHDPGYPLADGPKRVYRAPSGESAWHGAPDAQAARAGQVPRHGQRQAAEDRHGSDPSTGPPGPAARHVAGPPSAPRPRPGAGRRLSVRRGDGPDPRRPEGRDD